MLTRFSWKPSFKSKQKQSPFAIHILNMTILSKMVVVSAVSTIVPANPTSQPCRHSLSNIDLVNSSNAYTKAVCYYPSHLVPKVPYDLLVCSLKESLSRALVHYYVLAGRLTSAESGRLEVDCNDRGVPFVEAFTDASFSDWEDMKDCSIEDQLNSPETYISGLTDSPLIQFQVTRFRCGGIALGNGILDIIMDGYSAIVFINSWSELHRGLPLSKPPIFSSSLLKPRDPPIVSKPVRDYISSPQLQPGYGTINYKIIDDASLYHHKIFSMSEHQLNELIEEVQAGPFSYGTPTSFEALAAMVWKAITQVRDLPDSTITNFLYCISIRSKNRWDPAIPKDYFGNTALSPCLPAKAGDIKSNHLSYIARLFHEDIQNYTVEKIKSDIDWMQIELDKGLQLGFNCDFNSGADINCASLHTFPIYEADFGWGRPTHYSLVLHPWYGNGAVFMMPTPEGGRNRRILISLPKQQMKKLLQHELFTKFTS